MSLLFLLWFLCVFSTAQVESALYYSYNFVYIFASLDIALGYYARDGPDGRDVKM